MPSHNNKKSEAVDRFFGELDSGSDLFGKEHSDASLPKGNVTSSVPAHLEEDRCSHQLRIQALRIENVLARYGKLTTSSPPNGPHALAVCIPQYHGTSQMLIQNSPEQTQSWLREQERVMGMLSALVEEIGRENVVFFIERFPDDYPYERVPADFLAMIETSSKKGCHDLAEAGAVGKRLSNIDPQFRPNIMTMTAALSRFPIKMLRAKVLRPDQVHGFATPNQDGGRQMLAAKTPAEFSRLQAEDFRMLHEELVRTMQEKLPKGKVGIVLLGAGHFRTKKNLESSAQFLDADQMKRLEEVMVDAYLQTMDSTMTITLET